MTDLDWVDLTDVILTALTFSDKHLLSDACRILQDWEDKPEGLVWDDGLGWKDGRIWIPEDDCNETTHFSPIFPIILHTIMSSFVIT
jgi:hypothetical protein